MEDSCLLPEKILSQVGYSLGRTRRRGRCRGHLGLESHVGIYKYTSIRPARAAKWRAALKQAARARKSTSRNMYTSIRPARAAKWRAALKQAARARKSTYYSF